MEASSDREAGPRRVGRAGEEGAASRPLLRGWGTWANTDLASRAFSKGHVPPSPNSTSPVSLTSSSLAPFFGSTSFTEAIAGG